MSTPDSVAGGAVKYLATLPDVVAAVGAFPASDPNPVNASKPWIFNTDLLQTVEGTGKVALVCRNFGGVSVAAPLTTPRLLRLAIDIWVDPARDTAGNGSESGGATVGRGLAVFSLLHLHLQRRDPAPVIWGDLVTVGCELLTEPQFFAVSDRGNPAPSTTGWSNRPQLGTAFYAVSVFGYTDALS